MPIAEWRFWRRESVEEEPKRYVTLSCQSCGWRSSVAALPIRNENEVKIPQWQVNQARDHWNAYRGFRGSHNNFGGIKHHCFDVMVADNEDSNHGLMGKPATVIINNRGKTSLSNEPVFDQ